MNEHRYILEKYSGNKSRHTCPGCGYAREFTLYIDTSTGTPVGDNVGMCNRKGKCSYHFTPKQYFDKNGTSPVPVVQKITDTPSKELFTMPIEYVNDSMCRYHQNSFANCLKSVIGEDAAVNVLQNYECIGTSIRYPGACIFWQIDRFGQVRTGKIMGYKPDFHRDGFTAWAHGNASKIPSHLELRQCLFGLHLLTLKDKNKTICITESEKSAIICSHFFPQFIWMAAGSLDGLSEKKLQPLRGRKVILYPDLGKGYEVWTKKAQEYKHITDIKVSQYLQEHSTPEQKREGADIADFLLNEQLINA